ncbi:MAG: sigma-70 family RNA polymerase sigma factor [Clostridiales bacterium]|nr:sigma-70 family RNA polymerase sigma factor [Clostridiales bacterium]
MDAFEKIYNEYFSRVYAFLFKLCNDTHLAEEMTQESFYQAYKSFHRYTGSCDIFTWLAAVAKHTYYKHLRKNKHRHLSLDAQETEICVHSDHQPEHQYIEKEQRERLRESINRLPDKYRDVVILRIYADLPFSQIACVLKINENSAKVIFYRAKNMIMEDVDNENSM